MDKILERLHIIYDNVRDVGEGMHECIVENRVNIVNRKGQVIATDSNVSIFVAIYESKNRIEKKSRVDYVIGKFKNGKCIVSDRLGSFNRLSDTKYWFIDSNGNILSDKYLFIGQFYNKYCCVVDVNGKFGILNEPCNKVLNTEFNFIKRVVDDYYKVEKDGQYALFDANKGFVTDFKYEDIDVRETRYNIIRIAGLNYFIPETIVELK